MYTLYYFSFFKSVLNMLRDIQYLTGAWFTRSKIGLFVDNPVLNRFDILFMTSLSNSLYKWHRSEIGRKLFTFSGSLPGLINPIICDSLYFFVILCDLMQLPKNVVIHLTIMAQSIWFVHWVYHLHQLPSYLSSFWL